MLKSTRTAVSFGLLLLCTGPLFTAWAQSDRGTITGTVTDGTGAVLVGVSLTAVDVATGVRSKTTSGQSGTYTIPLLLAGTYQVISELVSFKTHVRDQVGVQVNQTTRLDLVMEVGELSQTVQVEAEEPLLRSDTSELGTVVRRQQFQDLPLIGQGEVRNPTFFMILVPGVTGRGTANSTADKFDSRILSTTVSGSQSGSTEFHLDGSIIASAGEFSADPRNVGFPPDAVGGFKMITVNAPAEYGRSGGGIASFTSKSGTNRLHGSLYEYFRNDALDARGFFAPTTPANRQNEFGATAGGPIRKDKTFFFGWYNGFRIHQALANSFATVPTAAMNHHGGLGPTLASDGFRLYFTELVDTHWTLAAMSVRGSEIVQVPTPFKDVTLSNNSPDGSELLIIEGQFGQEGPLWVLPVAGGSPRRVGDAVGHDGNWSPDGKRIAFAGQMPGAAWKIYLVAADGSTPPAEAVAQENCLVPAWSPEGDSLILNCGKTSLPGDTAIYVPDLRSHKLSAIPDSYGFTDPHFSPDGRSVVAHDPHQVSLFDLGQRKWLTLVTIENSNWTVWSREGRYVYFMTEGNEAAIYRVRLADHKLEKLASLKNVQPLGNWLSLAPDDSPIIVRSTGTDEIYALDWEAP